MGYAESMTQILKQLAVAVAGGLITLALLAIGSWVSGGGLISGLGGVLDERFQAEVNRTDERVKEIKTTLSQEVIRECRVCFQEIENSDQCQGNRNSCSGWSSNPSWTKVFRDDTDGRGGGCRYQWKLECR